MLVLSRKAQEQIVIGDNIVITVLSVRGGRVKIGFAGPPDVSIRRTELAAHPSRPQQEDFAATDLCCATSR
jgi:carbon storage regulator